MTWLITIYGVFVFLTFLVLFFVNDNMKEQFINRLTGFWMTVHTAVFVYVVSRLVVITVMSLGWPLFWGSVIKDIWSEPETDIEGDYQ